MRFPLLTTLALGWLTVTAAAAQTILPTHTVFCLVIRPRTGCLPPTAQRRQLRRVLAQQATPFTVVHLGDIVANEGLAAKNATASLAQLFAAAHTLPGQLPLQEFDRQDDSLEPHGPALFDRTFEHSETEEICVYGLDRQDIFRVTGQGGRRSIVVRVVGKDNIADDSRAAGPETDDRRSGQPDVNLYDHKAFEFNSYAPKAGQAATATSSRSTTS